MSARAAIFVAAVVLAGSAHAASPDYCTTYSLEMTLISVAGFVAVDRATATSDAIGYLFNRNYSFCLNQDEDPPVPFVERDGVWLKALLPATPAAIPANPEPKPPASYKGGRGKSGYVAGTASWNKWCGSHYRSFDARTGTVLKHRRGARTKCPG